MTKWQDDVNRFLDQTGLRCTPEFRLLDMQSELGEVGKEILKASAYGSRPAVVTEALREELGDLLFSLLAFAAENDIDAEAEMKGALAKYRDRLAIQGSAASDGRST